MVGVLGLADLALLASCGTLGLVTLDRTLAGAARGRLRLGVRAGHDRTGERADRRRDGGGHHDVAGGEFVLAHVVEGRHHGLGGHHLDLHLGEDLLGDRLRGVARDFLLGLLGDLLGRLVIGDDDLLAGLELLGDVVLAVGLGDGLGITSGLVGDGLRGVARLGGHHGHLVEHALDDEVVRRLAAGRDVVDVDLLDGERHLRTLGRAISREHEQRRRELVHDASERDALLAPLEAHERRALGGLVVHRVGGLRGRHHPLEVLDPGLHDTVGTVRRVEDEGHVELGRILGLVLGVDIEILHVNVPLAALRQLQISRIELHKERAGAFGDCGRRLRVVRLQQVERGPGELGITTTLRAHRGPPRCGS